MKPKTFILMVVAVVCGLGASYMTSRLLAERNVGDVEPEKVMVLVAKKNLDMGLPIKKIDEMFQEKPFLKGEEPKNAITNREQMKNRVLKRSLRAGDFVTPDDLLGEGQSGIAAALPAGFRAVGLRVNLESIAGGFASLPHSRVDIISTIRKGDDKRSFSRILLEDVLVLAADTNTVRDENGRAMPASVVTVALKPEDALKVAMTRELGTLSLVLRKFNDKSKAERDRLTVAQILSGGLAKGEVDDGDEPEVKLPPPKIEPQPEAKKEDLGRLHKLRIIEGDKERVVNYLVPENGNVNPPEVQRSEPRSENPPASKEEDTAPPKQNN
jgi:pilus assembly protein CpaB